MSLLYRLPLFVILMGIGSLAMLIPAIHAYALDLHRVGQPFLYGAVLFGVLSLLLGVATMGRASVNAARTQLLTLCLAYLGLPLLLALPMREAIGDARLFTVYFEMVSSFTTTGATVFDTVGRLSPPLHLWRGLVGWMGGFFILLTAAAILAPLNLGGFEVLRTTIKGNAAAEQTIGAADMSERLVRFTLKLFPLYLAATLVLWFVLIVASNTPFHGLMLSMATLSTSGILPGRPLEEMNTGFWTEAAIFVFLIAAITRQTFARDAGKLYWSALKEDRELKFAFIVVSALTLALFMRHWIGAFDINEQDNFTIAAQALWGALFSILSFLTTTGFVSADWDTAQSWSALPTPGLIFAGLAMLGGGVATTAGGLKLLRVYALYKNGVREMERLVHPSSVGSGGGLGRELRRDGAFVAWIFFMLYSMSIAVFIVALSLSGLRFEDATGFAISALSTTGPLAEQVVLDGIDYRDLGDPARIILIGAMVLGRLETLAIIALFNPEFWRN